MNTENLVTKDELLSFVNAIIASFRQQQPLSRTDIEALIRATIPECYHEEPSGYGGTLQWKNGFMQYSNSVEATSSTTGGGLPSNANKSKWMVPTLWADNTTATDNPALWTVGWIRAHA